MPAAWRDKETGAVFTRAQFAEHRWEEAWRLARNWFIFGTIPALLAALCQNQFAGRSFLARFSLFLAMDAAAALIIAMRIL